MNFQNWNINYRLAAGLAVSLLVWMASGLVSLQKSENIAARGQPAALKSMTVQVKTSRSRTYKRTIHVAGRTEANRSIDVVAEIDGQVIDTPAEEGASIEKGDAMCVLDSQDRMLRLEQARALRKKAEIDYQGALKLKDRGFQSKIQIAAAKADLAVAEAGLKASTLAVERLVVRAPFDGLVQEQLVEVGGFVERGSPCARLIELTPLVVVGFVPEADVAKLSVNDVAEIHFLDGTLRVGRLRYISRAADPITRTFKIEVEFDNKSLQLVDGLSADLIVFTGQTQAHLVSPSLLVLLGENRVGVKVVDENQRVDVLPVKLLGDSPDGVWLSGLPEQITLITVGQEYVTAGSEVLVSRAGRSDASASGGVHVP